MSKRRVLVVAALIADGERVLAARRHEGGPRGGQWEFPGGKVEPGESEPVALVRELVEELGVRVEVGAEYARLEHEYADLHVELAFYWCRIVEGAPRALGSQEVRWVERRGLGSLDFCAADAPLIERLKAL